MADQTPLLSDGMLGWPGFGPGGSQQWKVQRLYTGDIWYAPRSGVYLISGCGGGGGGGGADSTTWNGGGGGSGATLLQFPLFLPEYAGGVVTIGSGGSGGSGGGSNGSNGTATKLGDCLILGGGVGGTSVSNSSGIGGATGTISGWAVTLHGVSVNSQGAGGQNGVLSTAGGEGGASAVRAAGLTNDVRDDFMRGLFAISPGGNGGRG